MRMARAFMASVPMGIVLVAALVVPLAVIPGTFGFDRWPSSRGERVTERQVRLAPPEDGGGAGAASPAEDRRGRRAPAPGRGRAPPRSRLDYAASGAGGRGSRARASPYDC